MARTNKSYRSPCERNRIWRIWRSMRERGGVISVNAYRRDRHYKYYRDVFVCELWAKHFWAFERWALKNGYRDDLTLDRLDGLGGYCPSNCRWATLSQQNQNRRMTKKQLAACRRNAAKGRAVQAKRRERAMLLAEAEAAK